MLEAEIEAYLRRIVRGAGGDVRKVKWIGHNGAPDRLVGLRGRHVLVELKRPGAKPEPHQHREHRRLRETFGFEVLVIDSKAGCDMLVDSMLGMA